MNKLLLPAALLLCAAACAPAPSNIANTNTNAANTNATNANSAAASWTDADVIAGDRAAWDAIKRKEWTAFSDMLAPEFIDVTPDGVYDKEATVAAVKKLELTDATLSDFKVVKINDDAAISIYTATSKGTMDGKPIPADGKAYHSTVKVWRGGKWLAVLHQETPSIPIPPPAPSAAASASPAASATASASPAASPVATTSDVVANEKLIWDALKRKDWNAFANFLAEDQVEVWGETGISTKAQSVKGVQSVDFSDFQLSDFKTVPIDDDAKIVVYTVKGTGPDKKPFTERASSVWAVRGGKWLALFHQGTPAM